MASSKGLQVEQARSNDNQMTSKRVDTIINEEQRRIPGVKSHAREAVNRAIGRSAHRSARKTAERFSVPGIIDYLGASIITKHEWQEGKTKFVDPVPEDERAQFGYGDLPDDLIRDVEAEVSYIIPDSANIGEIKKVTGRVMLEVRENPQIKPHDLRDNLTNLPTRGRELGISNAVAIDGAVNIAHYMTAGYYSVQTSQAQAEEAERVERAIKEIST